MESVTDILDSANSVYYRFLSAAELRAQEARLAAAMKDAFVNEKKQKESGRPFMARHGKATSFGIS